MKVGVILFNLGGPERPSEVRPFLYKLFSDPEIIRLPRWLQALQRPLAWGIAMARQRKSTRCYLQIGGGSPLRRITGEQAEALQDQLAQRGLSVQVFVAMRYWQPFTVEALDEIEKAGLTDLVLLPLYPQFSVATTGSSLTEFYRALAQWRGLQHLRLHEIRHWHEHAAYQLALAALIEQTLAQTPATEPHLLFSAHGVPQSYITNGDPYLAQTEATVRDVGARLGKQLPVHLSFQSKVGPVKWLEPSTDAKLRELAAQGVQHVVVVPVSFVSDHVETLYELDIQYRQLAAEVGITHYARVPALNCFPAFIAALADLVQARLASAA